MALSVGNKNGRELRIHENAVELSNNLAKYIAELSEASIKERGAFAIALSGGSLITLMGKLCEILYNKTVDWAKWYIFWADERVVAKSHADSNYKLAKDSLFSKVPIIHNHVHSINDSVTAEQAAEDYEFVIRQLVRTRVINVSEVFDCPKFDLVLPWNVRYMRELWVTFITDPPKPPPERITFTLPVINSASNVAVVVTGVSKSEAVHLALDNIGPESPARMVSPINGKLVWFHDITAASKLEGIKFLEWS